jgi:formyltetrahydrofolate synthetase
MRYKRLIPLVLFLCLSTLIVVVIRDRIHREAENYCRHEFGLVGVRVPESFTLQRMYRSQGRVDDLDTYWISPDHIQIQRVTETRDQLLREAVVQLLRRVVGSAAVQGTTSVGSTSWNSSGYHLELNVAWPSAGTVVEIRRWK